jgi:hypothetical protein
MLRLSLLWFSCRNSWHAFRSKAFSQHTDLSIVVTVTPTKKTCGAAVVFCRVVMEEGYDKREGVSSLITSDNCWIHRDRRCAKSARNSHAR